MASFLFRSFAINGRWDRINLYRSVISKLYPIFLDFDFDLTISIPLKISYISTYIICMQYSIYVCLFVCPNLLMNLVADLPQILTEEIGRTTRILLAKLNNLKFSGLPLKRRVYISKLC